MRLIDADELNEYVGREALDTRGKIFALVDRMPTIERPHGEWIFCTDKLPDKDGYYIVSHLFCGEPEVGKSWFNTERGFTFGMVYAWMPMPKPCEYKKEQKLFKRELREGDENDS